MTKKYFYIQYPEDGGGVAYAPTDIQSDKLIDYRNEQECPFSFELRGGFKKDFLASDIGWQIFSSRARNVIEQAKSGRICWINVHLSSVASKLAPLYALLFDEKFDVLCRERTIYVDDFAVRAVLDPSKIGVDLFPVLGDPGGSARIIVSEGLKRRLEMAQLVGFDFAQVMST